MNPPGEGNISDWDPSKRKFNEGSHAVAPLALRPTWRQLDWDMLRGGRHNWASISGSVALERFQNEKKLLSKHGRNLAVTVSPLSKWIIGNSITCTRSQHLISQIRINEHTLGSSKKALDRSPAPSPCCPPRSTGSKFGRLVRSTPYAALGGGMTHWAASVVAILLAGFAGVASAQVNCEAIPHGPARTDCYLGLSEFYRGQSDLAAARARAQSDAAWYRAITGTDPPKHKPHRRR